MWGTWWRVCVVVRISELEGLISRTGEAGDEGVRGGGRKGGIEQRERRKGRGGRKGCEYVEGRDSVACMNDGPDVIYKGMGTRQPLLICGS